MDKNYVVDISTSEICTYSILSIQFLLIRRTRLSLRMVCGLLERVQQVDEHCNSVDLSQNTEYDLRIKGRRWLQAFENKFWSVRLLISFCKYL